MNSSSIGLRKDFGTNTPNDLEKWENTMKREMQEIIPGLFLGPYCAAVEDKFYNLIETGITHIICVRHEKEATFIQPNFPDWFRYIIINLDDSFTSNIIPIVPQVKQFIDDCLKSRGKVLVHSYQGMSRSATLVIAYVMETLALSFRDAVSLVRNKRCCIDPNEAFMHQLKEYEPIYKARRLYNNGHSSKETGLFKRQFDEVEDMAQSINGLDIDENRGASQAAFVQN